MFLNLNLKRFTKTAVLILLSVVTGSMFGCGDSGGGGGKGLVGGGVGGEPNVTYGSLTDSRDGKTYRTVVIGTRTWMAENLNYATSSGSWCYDNQTSNCNTYGRLYDWATAMGLSQSYNTTSYTPSGNHRGVCPTGWHLPSVPEWEALVNTVGGASDAGTKLKSSAYWQTDPDTPAGTNQYGFSALPGGVYDENYYGFLYLGSYGNWWSTKEDGQWLAWNWGLQYDYKNSALGFGDKTAGRSVRCVKD